MTSPPGSPSLLDRRVVRARHATIARALGVATLLAGVVTGCATGDGRQLRDPVFDLPEPSVTVLDSTSDEVPTLPPSSSAPVSTVAGSAIEIVR